MLEIETDVNKAVREALFETCGEPMCLPACISRAREFRVILEEKGYVIVPKSEG